MINENTAFENYCSHSNIHGGYASKRDFVAGWQAAKQSMQGEHVGTIGHDFETGSPYVNWRIDTTQIAGAKLYTNAPDSAARIAELEAQVYALKAKNAYLSAQVKTQGKEPQPPCDNDHVADGCELFDASLNIKRGAE